MEMCGVSVLSVFNFTWSLPGLPEDLIQKGKDIKGVSEIVHEGKKIKLTITYGPKVVRNEFTLGEECELETMTGEKVKVCSSTSISFPELLLTETMSLKLLQAGDTESFESRLLIVSGIVGIWALTMEEDVGIMEHREGASVSGLPGTVLLALRVLQGKPRTGAHWCQ